MRVLVLGGSTEASQLARRLAEDGRFAATLSLAGRTANPAPQPVPCRTGGFGGVDGLAAYLHTERIAALIDATHPFAAQISRHAAEAARQAGVPLVAVRRAGWEPGPGDRWNIVPTMQHAADGLGRAKRRVFLTIGAKDLAPFAAAPWHAYLIRAVDPPPPAALPVGAEVITARGPFSEADEHRLLQERSIEVLVTKNSGGAATQPKLDAARRLGLPVVMVARPPAPERVESVADAEAAMAWLRHLALRGA